MPETQVAEVKGRVDDRFQAMADILRDSVASGTELGASIAVTVDGELVVDAYAGWTDEARTQPWQADTITNVFSTTKTVTNLAALVLADRGVIDLHAPVARYWPEFGGNGKEAVEVRHVLSHTSGVSGWEQPVTIEDTYDVRAAADRLAAQAPWWKPGSASGYHGLSQGHLVGEIVRRADGRTLGRFVKEEITDPLGVTDFFIGLPPSEDGRVVRVVPPPADAPAIDLATLDPDSIVAKTLLGPASAAEASWTDAWRRHEGGAANGQANARAVAAIHAMVANGGRAAGRRFLSQDTIDLIFEEQSNGVDLVLGIPIRFGIGYALPTPESVPYVPEGRVCFWGGWGGSMIVVDTERRATIAYVMNKMEGSIIGGPRTQALVEAAYAALDV